jgi:hypothetical protein
MLGSDVQEDVVQCFMWQPKEFFADGTHQLVHQRERGERGRKGEEERGWIEREGRRGRKRERDRDRQTA